MTRLNIRSGATGTLAAAPRSWTGHEVTRLSWTFDTNGGRTEATSPAGYKLTVQAIGLRWVWRVVDRNGKSVANGSDPDFTTARADAVKACPGGLS